MLMIVLSIFFGFLPFLAENLNGAPYFPDVISDVYDAS